MSGTVKLQGMERGLEGNSETEHWPSLLSKVPGSTPHPTPTSTFYVHNTMLNGIVVPA